MNTQPDVIGAVVQLDEPLGPYAVQAELQLQARRDRS